MRQNQAKKDQLHLILQEVKDIHRVHDSSSTAEHANFHIPTCVECKKTVHFDAGDIINGNKWYHSACWSTLEKKQQILCQN
jgi:hypothetical protein